MSEHRLGKRGELTDECLSGKIPRPAQLQVRHPDDDNCGYVAQPVRAQHS